MRADTKATLEKLLVMRDGEHRIDAIAKLTGWDEDRYSDIAAAVTAALSNLDPDSPEASGFCDCCVTMFILGAQAALEFHKSKQ